MLEIEGISFAFGHHRILDRVGLTVRPGEMVCVLGPNGVGKSTLLKCILQLVRPSHGEVRVGDRRLSSMDLRQKARRLAYVEQRTPARFPMTVFETVLMGRRPYLSFRPGKKDFDKVATILGALGLGAMAQREFNQLSGGQQQKVMLARGLVQEPRYLLLDEPTASLDLRHQLEVMELLQRFCRDREMGMVVAIHDLNLALRYADQVVLLQDGRVMARGRPQEVLRPETIGAVYGVEVVEVSAGGLSGLIPVRPI
jgi:iron complex transport system ATP-binding protein